MSRIWTAWRHSSLPLPLLKENQFIVRRVFHRKTNGIPAHIAFTIDRKLGWIGQENDENSLLHYIDALNCELQKTTDKC